MFSSYCCVLRNGGADNIESLNNLKAKQQRCGHRFIFHRCKRPVNRSAVPLFHPGDNKLNQSLKRFQTVGIERKPLEGERRETLNRILQAWLGRRLLTEVMEQLASAGGVVGPLYDAAQIAEEAHYRQRQEIVKVDDLELGPMRMPGVVPKFNETPGGVEHAGPTRGEHNREVYGSWLSYGEEEVNGLAASGVICR